MSIPSSFVTATAWDKFVEKYGAFMRNFNTKVKNEKRNKNYVFIKNGDFLLEFGLFCSRFTTSL